MWKEGGRTNTNESIGVRELEERRLYLYLALPIPLNGRAICF